MDHPETPTTRRGTPSRHGRQQPTPARSRVAVPAPGVPKPGPIDAKQKADPGKEDALRDAGVKAGWWAAYRGWIGPLLFPVPGTGARHYAYLPPGKTEADFGGREGMPSIPVEGLPWFVTALAMMHGEGEQDIPATSTGQPLYDYLDGLAREARRAAIAAAVDTAKAAGNETRSKEKPQ